MEESELVGLAAETHLLEEKEEEAAATTCFDSWKDQVRGERVDVSGPKMPW